MKHKIFWNILDDRRKALLPQLAGIKNTFYLAGGTGLALQLGHRESQDFDFFSITPFSTGDLFMDLKRCFPENSLLRVQEEKDTLSIILDEGIKLSFLSYPYPLVGDLVETNPLNIASIEDIALMKFSAICARSLQKDYVDLYFILRKISLPDLLPLVPRKFKDLDINLVLKSLVYFNDLKMEPILFQKGKEVNFPLIEKFLIATVEKFARSTFQNLP